MKGFKSTEQTRYVSLVLMGIYVIYGIFKIPLLEYGVSIAVGGLVYMVTKMPEFGVIGVLVSTILLPMVRSSREGFADSPTPGSRAANSPTPASREDASPTPASRAANSPTPASRAPVTGAASPSTKDAGDVGAPNPIPSFVGTSTPASAFPAPTAVKKISEKDVPPANQPADLIPSAPTADGFADSNSGLFKLGQIPTDEKGGFHIDTGTSVLNALKSLKPDQISAMTQDTKQLIETQKTLMNMLQSFKPMLSEGKDMMDTFQQMFSSSGGSAMGALQAAEETLKK
jgi:hypothetical protein